MLLVFAFLLALAVPASGQSVIVMLTQGTPTAVTSTPLNYGITIQQGSWNVVGIGYQSFDWTLTHGTATSAQSGFVTEYVLADGNTGTIAGNTGTATTTGSPVRGLICHAARGTLAPGSSATYSWAGNVVAIWEVPIASAGTYNISVAFQGLSVTTTMRYAWFNPQNNAAWIDRSQAAFSNPMGTPQNNYTVSAAGTYCLVAYEDAPAGLTNGVVTATVTQVTSNASFQAVSVSVPGAPVTVNPGGTFTANSQIANTGGTAGSTSYGIYLSTDASITTADTLVCTGTTTSIAPGGTYSGTDTCTVPGAQGAGSYYVGLYLAPSNTAVTANADVTVNAVGTPPGPFSLVAPANAATGVSTSPTYTWTVSAGATTYDLAVATDAAMTNLVVNKTGITGTSDTPAVTLSSSTIHYWQVTAVNTSGNTLATGAPWSFTTAAATLPPAAFDLVSPYNLATGVSCDPLYSWNASAGAASYRLEVATDFAVTNLVVDRPGLTGTYDIPPVTLAPGTAYYWRVTALNAHGTTVSNGAPWSFTTLDFDPAATSVALLNPPVRVPLGATFDVTRTITNLGADAGAASFEIYLSLDTAIGPGDLLVYFGSTASIAGGAADTQSYTFDLPAGVQEGRSYYVGLTLDGGDTACSSDMLAVVRVEPKSALGCGAGAGGGAARFLPLALLAAAACLLRGRRSARARRA